MWSTRGLIFTALVAVSTAHSHSHVVDRRALPDEVERCVQDDEPSDVDIQHRVSEVAQFRTTFQARAADISKLVIPVVFHIIHDGSTGRVTQQRIDDQLTVLNGGFGGQGSRDTTATSANTGIQFVLSEVNYIDNSEWYYNCKASSYEFRPAHVRDTKQFFNVFTCSGDGYLGWTWLPWTHGEGSNMQAVIVNQNSFPGGSFSKYSLGYTLTHEAGHYFGLLHTFARGVCTGVGDDGVDDTPLEARGGSSCGADFTDYTRDTCSGDPGADPLWSFMDYSYDQCMQRFSPGQIDRMREMTSLHRPALEVNSFAGWLSGGGTGTDSPTRAPSMPPSKAPTTLSPTKPPTLAPTGAPSKSSTIRITSHTTSMNQSGSAIVTLTYTYTTLLPLVVKAEIHTAGGLWVGGSTITALPRSALRIGTGTMDLACSLHGKPFAAADYVITAWMMFEADLHTATPWTLRLDTITADGLLEIVEDDGDAGVADLTANAPNTQVCATFAAADVNWQIRSASKASGQTSTLANICAGSKSLAGVCFGQASHPVAVTTCEGLGARLCSAEELFNGVAKDTGCSSNSNYAWTSSACASGFLVLSANPTTGNLPPKCLDPTAAAAAADDVRTLCCADNIVALTESPTMAPTAPPPPPPPPVDCDDLVATTSCDRWSAAGFCQPSSLYVNYMALNCKSTCEMCDSTTTPEPSEPTCVRDVKDECTIGATSSMCCRGISVCSVWGKTNTLRCVVPNPEGGELYPVGELCNTHRQCGTGYCDKQGQYGTRFRCYAASSKSDGDESSGGGDGGGVGTTVTVVIAVSVGVLAAVIAVVVYQRRKAAVSFAQALTEASSSVGSFAEYPHAGGLTPHHITPRPLDSAADGPTDYNNMINNLLGDHPIICEDDDVATADVSSLV